MDFDFLQIMYFKYFNSSFFLKLLSEKICKVFIKTPVPQSLFNETVGLHLYLRENLVCGFSEIFLNGFFAEHLRVIAPESRFYNLCEILQNRPFSKRFPLTEKITYQKVCPPKRSFDELLT